LRAGRHRAWILHIADSAPGFVGSAQLMTLLLEPHQDITKGLTATLGLRLVL